MSLKITRGGGVRLGEKGAKESGVVAIGSGPSGSISRASSSVTAAYISSGLVMWLDGTDQTTMTRVSTRVDEWRDKLGSGLKVETATNDGLTTANNPVFTSSLYGNRGGVAFNNKYLATATAFSGLSWATGFTIMGAITRTARSGLFMINDDTSDVAPFSVFQGERLGVGVYLGSRQGSPRNVPYVHGVKHNGTSYKFSRSSSVYDKDLEGTNKGTTTFGRLHVGGLIGSNQYVQFNTAGLFFWNRALTDLEMQQMALWIEGNYGISSLASPTWNIVVDGNSIAVGYNSCNSTSNAQAVHDGILAATGSPLATDYVNVAKSAQTTAQLATRAATTVDPLLNTSITASRRILILWEGTNDISNGSDDTTAYNNIKNYCLARKAAGWQKIVVATILPRNVSSNPSQETYRLSVNQMIRDAKTNGESWLDAVADVGGDATYGISSAAANATFYNDGIHPRDVVHNALKTYFTSALNSL